MEHATTVNEPLVAPIGRLHWHPHVHRRWTGREMYFWFFTFTALYLQNEVIDALEEIYEELGITSYMAYEVLGSFDMVSRIYLEPAREAELSEALYERLGPLGLIKEQSFQVASVLRHWIWSAEADGTGDVRVPEDRILKLRFPVAELARLNDAEDQSPARQELIRRYAEHNLVTEASPSYGIKFILLIGSLDNPDGRTRNLATGRIKKALDGAKDLLVERSLYTGRNGQRELYLVMCRIEHRRFHELREKLLEPIGEAVAPIRGTRTTTFPVVSEAFLFFDDRVHLDEPDPPDVEVLLSGHETSRLEVKGALFSVLDPWLKEGKDLEESAAMPMKGVMKAIVGLLNSGGGTVVVGALEDDRYRDSDSARARLDEFPMIGRYRVIGLIDESYLEWGWDGWDKRLRGLVAAKIDKNPGVLVQTREETVMGKQVCVIDVSDAGEDDQFFLRVAANQSVFYARQGTDVVPLHGNAIAEHRKQVQHQRNANRIALRKSKRG